MRLVVVIHFPWDPDARLFTGERIYLDRASSGLRPLGGGGAPVTNGSGDDGHLVMIRGQGSPQAPPRPIRQVDSRASCVDRSPTRQPGGLYRSVSPGHDGLAVTNELEIL